jgi:hypothetical protein
VVAVPVDKNYQGGPASARSADQNLDIIMNEPGVRAMLEKGILGPKPLGQYYSNKIRDALEDAGIKGFKKGGVVRRTGIYQLHKGERVVPAGSGVIRRKKRR